MLGNDTLWDAALASHLALDEAALPWPVENVGLTC